VEGDGCTDGQAESADGDRRGEPSHETSQIFRLIDGILQAEGVTPEEMDARLGRPAGATAALLRGGEADRPRVLEILAALELAPEVFFRALDPPAVATATGQPVTAPLFERLAAELALAGYAPHPADDRADEGAAPDSEDLERRVREAVRAGLAGDSEGEK
jgi:hypothetical protein